MKLSTSAAVVAVATLATIFTAPVQATIEGNFVSTSGRNFVVQGKNTWFSGTNIYYLPTATETSIDIGLDLLKKHDLNVLRTWGFCESKTNCQFGSFVNIDNTTGAVTLNDTALRHLDYVIQHAKHRGIRLIIPFTNNWQDYGGMDVYTRALGGQYHDDFYTLDKVKDGFKTYIKLLLNRKNYLSGTLYKDDATIFAWEIANEPRCGGWAGLERSSSCNSTVTTNYFSEISTYIKSLDPKHLVCIGDEGFGIQTTQYPPSNTYVYSSYEGTDFAAELALPNIDFGTFHLYPVGWSLSNTTFDGIQWIKAHADVAKAVNKPVILEEFGVEDQSIQKSVYDAWYQAALDYDVSATMFWMASGSDYYDWSTYQLYDDQITEMIDPWTKIIKKKKVGVY